MFGCYEPGEREMGKAKRAEKMGQFADSVGFYKKAMLRAENPIVAIEAAREAARINFFETKNFAEAAEYYKFLVVNSRSNEERQAAQKQIATIFFDHLTDYQKAVVEINKLMNMSIGPDSRRAFQIKLARAYYYLNNFIQAESEVEEILKNHPTESEKFEMMVLKGNIFLAQKDLAKASQIFKQLVELNPEKATKDNVALTLAVAYEEMKDYKSAIEILTAMKAYHPMPEYLEIRIKRLAERKKNQPGARGMRK